MDRFTQILIASCAVFAMACVTVMTVSYQKGQRDLQMECQQHNGVWVLSMCVYSGTEDY